MMSFTGSTRAGIAVTRDSADTVKRVTLELGGKSPNLVFADCDLEARVANSVRECFYNTGQSCDAPTRMLVERNCYEEAKAIAKAAAEATVVGNPNEEGDRLGPLFDRIQFDRVQALILKGIEEGATLLTGGPGRPEVSVEESIRDRLDLAMGDVLQFRVLGRDIRATVSSVRAVDWDDSRSGGFMFLFSPGVFDEAPHSFISFLRGPPETAARARLQRDLVAGFPNVSVIDGLEVIATVRRILDYVTLAISVVGGIAVFSGVLILIGSVAMTKYQRRYETAIFQTLGATRRSLVTMLVVEYGTLGVLAGAVGSVGALGLTWGLSRHLLEIDWNPAPVVNLGGMLLTALVVGGVGVAASLDALRRKPLGTLRAE
jgi:hypothetical protein